MMNLKHFFFISIYYICFCFADNEKYTLLSYHEIVNFMHNLTEHYPHLLKYESVHDKYGVPHQSGNCGNSKCTIYVATITDFNINNRPKVKVYLSGNLHGDEKLGPNVLVYLAEYLVKNFNTEDKIKTLLKERIIIMTPMTNAQGYYHNRREEQTDTNMFVDINRDFPYNRLDSNCFLSVAARAIFKIFQNNLIYGCLTYHGGTEVIGYPWGSYNHLKKAFLRQTSTEAPDDKMFERIAKVLQKQSGVYGWSDLTTGSMSDTVYPCYGALEDWAYGASWDTSNNARSHECNPPSYKPFNNTEYFTKFEHIKPAIYLIESSDQKSPDESKFGSRKDIYCQSCSSNGHVNRHIRLILAYIDLMKVYPVFNNMTLVRQNTHVQINWKFNGCLILCKNPFNLIKF